MTTKTAPGNRWGIDPGSPWLPVVVLTVLWGLGFRQILLFDTAARSYAITVVAALAVVVALEAWIWYGTRLSYPARIALTALGFGCIMMFTMTPLAIPDEQAHYENALKGAAFLFGREYPVSLFDYTGLVGHYNVSSGYVRVAQDLFGTLPAGGETLSLGGMPAYFPEYLPQTVGVTIGLLLKGNMVTLFMLGRFTNLLFYCFCVYAALRRAPVYRELLGTVSLLPMALHQAASLSYDGFIVGLSLLYMASLFYSREKDGLITRSELLWIAVPGVLLAPTRAVYLVLALLFLLIPRKRFPSTGRRILCFVLLTGACACLTLGSQASTLSSLGSDALNWEGTVNYTVADILADPVGVLRLFLVSFVHGIPHWVFQAHGTTLAGLSLPMPRFVAGGFSLMLFATVLDTAPQGKPVLCRERILGVIVVLGTVAGMMLAMLLAWTSITRDEIQGVQGRYFLPVLPLAYWLFASKKPLLHGKTAAWRPIIILTLLMEMVLYTFYYTLAH